MTVTGRSKDLRLMVSRVAPIPLLAHNRKLGTNKNMSVKAISNIKPSLSVILHFVYILPLEAQNRPKVTDCL